MIDDTWASRNETGLKIQLADGHWVRLGALPDDHRLQGRAVYCEVCESLVHGYNNELVRPWLETGNEVTDWHENAICLYCYAEQSETET